MVADPEDRPPATTRRRAYACVLVALAAVIYGNTLAFDYVLDDHLFITHNRFTQRGMVGLPDIFMHDAVAGFFSDETQPIAGGRYRPLSLATHAVEFAAFGLRPGVSHALNVLCYAATILMLFLLLGKLLPRSAEAVWYRNVPFLTAALFAVHPLHTEVVAPIKGRDDLMSLLLGLWALYVWLAYVERRTWSTAFASGFLLFLSLLSKESTVTLVVGGPLLLWSFTQRNLRAILTASVPLLVGTVAYVGLRYAVIGSAPATVAPELMNDPFLHATGGQRLATVFLTLLLYLKLLVFPHPLTHDYYPYHIPLVGFSDPRVIASLVLTFALIVLGVRGAARRTVVSFCIAWYFATLVLYSNLIFDVGILMNERFLYVPSLSFCLLLAWVLIEYLPDRRLVAGVSILLILAGATKTFARNFAWKDDVTLATTDVETSANSARAQWFAGWAHVVMAEEEPEGAKRDADLAEAIDHLRISLSITDDYYPTAATMASALVDSRRYAEALNYYALALRMKPHDADSTNAVLAVAQRTTGQGDFPTAIRAYEMLLAQQPSAELYAALGLLYGEKLKDLPHAEAALEKALSLESDNATIAGNLGIVYAMEGRTADAIALFDRALAREPRNASLYRNKARALRQLGRDTEAEQLTKRAAELEPAQP